MPTRFMTFVVVVLLANRAPAQEPIVLQGHGGWVGAVAFAPDSETFAVGAGDGSITLWDVTLAKKLGMLPGHKDAVAALAFTKAGATLVSGGHDHLAIVHRINRDSTVKSKQQVLKGHRGAVMALALTPDGKKLYTGSIDSTIREWDVEKFETIRVLRDHTSWVNGLAISRDAKWLASASSDNSVLVRGAGSEQQFKVVIADGEIRSVALSPDGKRVAAGIRYGGVRVWNLDNNKDAASLKAHAGETWAVAFTPDGKTLASGGGDWNQPGEVRLWDLATRTEKAALQHTGEVLCVAISPDGRYVAAGSWDRSVRVWKLARP